MADISFITSSRGGRLLLCNGHLYTNTCKDYKGKTYWACEKKGCHGRVCLKNDECAYEIGTHDHEPNVKKIARLKFMEKLKEMVKQDLTTPVGKIYRDLYQSLSKEFKSVMPSLKTVENILHRYRSSFKAPIRQRNTVKMRRYPNQEQTNDNTSKDNLSEIVEDLPSPDLAEQNKFLEIFSLMFLDSQGKQETQLCSETNSEEFHTESNVLPESEPLSDIPEIPNKVLENLSTSNVLINSQASHETSVHLKENSPELALEQDIFLNSHPSHHSHNEIVSISSSDAEKCEIHLFADQNSPDLAFHQDKSSTSHLLQNNTSALSCDIISLQKEVENSTHLHTSSIMQDQRAQLASEKLLTANECVLLKSSLPSSVSQPPNAFNAPLGMMDKLLNTLSETKEASAQPQTGVHKQVQLLSDPNSYVQIQMLPSVSMMPQPSVILQPSYNLLNSAILPSLPNAVLTVIPHNISYESSEIKTTSISNEKLCSHKAVNVSLSKRNASQQTLISTKNYLIRQRRKLTYTPYAAILLRAKQKAVNAKRQCDLFNNKNISFNRKKVHSSQLELAAAQFELAASQWSLAKSQHELAKAQQELAAAHRELAAAQREIVAAKKSKVSLLSCHNIEKPKCNKD